mmetsp:Transcript_5462/g.22407  ORF Transcript_5462/g.22407 Transcript_5462/m.22407 type:complete len:494 (+) Transcript_5462:546-2027(+)
MRQTGRASPSADVFARRPHPGGSLAGSIHCACTPPSSTTLATGTDASPSRASSPPEGLGLGLGLGDGSPPPTPEFLATVAGTNAELLLRLGDASAAEARLEPATATTRAHARALGLAEALLYPDARSVHNPAVGYLVGLLLLRADAVRRSPGRLAECATLLDEASSLCGSHTAATDARTHATIAMLRGHVAGRMRARGRGGDERTIAEASLTKALAWATSPGAAHDRRLIRACLLELASLHVPAAEAEAAGIGGGPPAASPDDAKATARVVACLRHAAKAARMRDAFEHESRIVADAASSTEWPAALIEAVAEEEAAREAAPGHAKLDDADVARARLAVASFVRLVGRLPAIGCFAPGARSARETAAATHSALASSCDAYKRRCCFAETSALPPGGDGDVDPNPNPNPTPGVRGVVISRSSASYEASAVSTSPAVAAARAATYRKSLRWSVAPRRWAAAAHDDARSTHRSRCPSSSRHSAHSARRFSQSACEP